jgi:hypothetical protein
MNEPTTSSIAPASATRVQAVEALRRARKLPVGAARTTSDSSPWDFFGLIGAVWKARLAPTILPPNVMLRPGTKSPGSNLCSSSKLVL